MKEIKFRAWDNVENEMYYTGEEELILFMFDSCGIVADKVIPDESEKGFYVEKLEHLQYMQFTGLKDKNDKEIFEGDIESDENGNLSVVCYLKKYGAYCFVPLVLYVHEDYENQVEYGYDCYFHNAIPSKYSTVVGNIYENPELLEESKNGTK